jgi:hypothetical protein
MEIGGTTRIFLVSTFDNPNLTNPHHPMRLLRNVRGAKAIRMTPGNALGLSWLLEAAASEIERDGRHGMAGHLRALATEWRAAAAERSA